MVRVQNLFAHAIVIVVWTKNYLIIRSFYLTGSALSAKVASDSSMKTTVRVASDFYHYNIP